MAVSCRKIEASVIPVSPPGIVNYNGLRGDVFRTVGAVYLLIKSYPALGTVLITLSSYTDNTSVGQLILSVDLTSDELL